MGLVIELPTVAMHWVGII